MRIHKFKVSDIEDLIEILRLNNQYECSEVDGPDAMKRILLCKSAVFLVLSYPIKKALKLPTMKA